MCSKTCPCNNKKSPPPPPPNTSPNQGMKHRFMSQINQRFLILVITPLRHGTHTKSVLQMDKNRLKLPTISVTKDKTVHTAYKIYNDWHVSKPSPPESVTQHFKVSLFVFLLLTKSNAKTWAKEGKKTHIPLVPRQHLRMPDNFVLY